MQPGITYKWDGVKFRGDAVGGAYAVSREQDVPPWVKHSPLKSARSGLFLNQSGQTSPAYYSLTEEALAQRSGERARSVSPQRFLEGQGAYQPNREGEYYYSNQSQPNQQHYYYQNMSGGPGGPQSPQANYQKQNSGDPNKRFIVITDGSGYNSNSPPQQQYEHSQQQMYHQQGGGQQQGGYYPSHQMKGEDLGPGYQQPDYVRVHAPPVPPYNYKSNIAIGTLTEYAHPPPPLKAPSVERHTSPVNPEWSTSHPYEIDQYKETVEIINQPYRTRPIITPSIKPAADRVVGSYLTPGLAQAGVPSSRDQTPQGRFQQFQSKQPDEFMHMRGAAGDLRIDTGSQPGTYSGQQSGGLHYQHPPSQQPQQKGFQAPWRSTNRSAVPYNAQQTQLKTASLTATKNLHFSEITTKYTH